MFHPMKFHSLLRWPSTNGYFRSRPNQILKLRNRFTEPEINYHERIVRRRAKEPVPRHRQINALPESQLLFNSSSLISSCSLLKIAAVIREIMDCHSGLFQLRSMNWFPQESRVWMTIINNKYFTWLDYIEGKFIARAKSSIIPDRHMNRKQRSLFLLVPKLPKSVNCHSHSIGIWHSNHERILPCLWNFFFRCDQGPFCMLFECFRLERHWHPQGYHLFRSGYASANVLCNYRLMRLSSGYLRKFYDQRFSWGSQLFSSAEKIFFFPRRTGTWFNVIPLNKGIALSMLIHLAIIEEASL